MDNCGYQSSYTIGLIARPKYLSGHVLCRGYEVILVRYRSPTVNLDKNIDKKFLLCMLCNELTIIWKSALVSLINS